MNFNSKYLLAILLFALGTLCINAQNNLGHNTDNYAGVYSLSYNPAEIVDSRFKFHMNVVSFGTTFSNNYIGIKRTALFSERDLAFDDENFADNYLIERLNGKKKGVYLSTEIMAPLSFMANFGKKHNNAIGFNMRVRMQTNVNGASESLATMSYNELLLSDLYNVGIQNENFSIQNNIWTEYGLTYGRDVINTGRHFVSAAGTAKLTHGLANVYFYSDNMNVAFPSDSSVSVDDSDINFGFSSVLGGNLENLESGDILGNGKYGFGFDLGAVWEFRPNADKYKYELDGNPDYLDPRKEKYKVKVGVGLLDMGFTNYERDNGVFGEYYADRADIDIEESFGAAFDEFGNSGLQAFEDTISSLFVETTAEKGTYKVSLPMRINAYVDYNIWKGFYANLAASIAPAFKNNPEKTRGISEFSITPRFEHKWFSFYLPVSVNTHGNPHFGTGMRVGPLALGTNDILPLMGKKTIYDANFYMNLSIPIGHKIKDKDKDHVSNKKDECRKEAGPWASFGCPILDSDEDGIMDKDDDCPNTPGLVAFNGCPDSDKDGIRDSEDKCPETAGIEKFNGCPDTDGDGIQDSADDCPEVVGIEEFNGCPDTDGDGIQDKQDSCPETAGDIRYNGCPDTDGDGLIDNEDACPEVAGAAENKGCPYGDEDNDGVTNNLDDCPKTPGPVENNGCPIIEEEVAEKLDIAFRNLEFESGRAAIKVSSYVSMDELAKVMIDNPEIQLLVEGHTDNIGNDSSNQILSENRANAVKTLLIAKGITGNRVKTFGFGESKPVASNETPEGRQANRRVEMTIVFE